MAGILDQSYTTFNDSNGIRTAVDTGLRYAQSFTPAVTGLVSEVIMLLHEGGSPTGNIWAEIWTNSGGVPGAITGTKSENVDVSTINGTFGTPTEVTFTFSTPPNITAGTLYWIVLDGDWALSGTNYIAVCNNNVSGYANGSAAEFNASWGAFGTRDLWFKQYYTLPPGGYIFQSY
jgi:hypothetical protein